MFWHAGSDVDSDANVKANCDCDSDGDSERDKLLAAWCLAKVGLWNVIVCCCVWR